MNFSKNIKKKKKHNQKIQKKYFYFFFFFSFCFHFFFLSQSFSFYFSSFFSSRFTIIIFGASNSSWCFGSGWNQLCLCPLGVLPSVVSFLLSWCFLVVSSLTINKWTSSLAGVGSFFGGAGSTLTTRRCPS